MSTRTTALSIAFLAAVAIPCHAGFDDDFDGRVLRVDYFHSGTATEEHFALDRAHLEGVWPGSRTQLIDRTNLGKYLVEVVDTTDNRVLYSRGFASIYGEWETTGEAVAGTWRTIPEAIRIPAPRRPFQLRLRKRGADLTFREVWAIKLDPRSRFVDRPAVPQGEFLDLQTEGSPATKVDLVILGDGYTADSAKDFEHDARQAAKALFAEEPFQSRRKDFNVRAVHVPSPAPGISAPRSGKFLDTPLRTRYNTFDSERYVLTLDDRRWRDAAAVVPYDFVLILINERKYGGGGIFGLYSTAAAKSAFVDYLVVHEFGHHFAALADEYYTSPVAYDSPDGARVEPWEPNVTALLDPETLKWADLVADETPLPTPWEKQTYEEQSRASQAKRASLRAEGADEQTLEALFRDEQAAFTPLLADGPHGDSIGAFEGAMYEAQGYYRPRADCLMFTRNAVGFCPVCRRAIERIIDLHSR